MLTGIGRKAQMLWRSKRLFRSEIEPVDDIQRDFLDLGLDQDEEAIKKERHGLTDIKTNWAENT